MKFSFGPKKSLLAHLEEHSFHLYIYTCINIYLGQNKIEKTPGKKPENTFSFEMRYKYMSSHNNKLNLHKKKMKKNYGEQFIWSNRTIYIKEKKLLDFKLIEIGYKE